MATSSEVDEEVIMVDDECHERSDDDRLKFHCIATWKIRNFSCCQLECGEELFSPLFCADSSAKVKWYISIFPNGQANFEEYVPIHVIFIRSSDRILGNLRASCRVFIIDSESNSWLSDRIDQNLARFQFNTFVKRERLFQEKSKVFSQDTLTIRCQISAFDERTFELGPGPSVEIVLPRSELLNSFANDFKDLFESGKFTDITLELQDGNISAHKAILMARSPVFATLIRESEAKDPFSIPDCSKSTMNALLRYMYSGQIDPAFPAFSLDLHEVAQTYKVRELSNAIAPNKIVAETEITNEKFTYTWRLKNFSNINTDLQTIRYSEKFHTGPSSRSWSLSVCFQKISEDDSDQNIGIYLNKLWTTGEKKAIYIHFSICLLDKDEQPHHTAEAKRLYKHSGRYGFSNFIKRSILQQQQGELLIADTLTIRCNMRVCDGANSSKVQHSFSSTSGADINDVEDLSHCFGELLSSEFECDVTVCATEKEFHLHKPILCARSTVFADFFDRYSNGLSNYTINIQGIKAEILELLFVFVYTGELANGLSCAITPELYAAADHYKISALKKICSEFMKSNACEIMVIVSLTSDSKIRDLVKDFICSNAEDVIMNDQWPEFVLNYPRLSSEILKSLTSGYREAKKRRVE